MSAYSRITHIDTNDYEEQEFSDINYEDDIETSIEKKRIRQLLEKRLERKRLKAELEDFDGELEDEFDWHQSDNDEK